jgi:hypothetical protein
MSVKKLLADMHVKSVLHLQVKIDVVKQLSEIIQSLRQSSSSSVKGPFPSSSGSSSFSSSDGSFSSSGSSPLNFEAPRFSSAGSPGDQSVDYGDDYSSFSPVGDDQRTGRSRKQKQARRHVQQQQQQQKGPSKSFG